MLKTTAPTVSMRAAQRESARQEVPGFLTGGLYVLLVAGALASFTRLDSYSPLPMTTLLDAWVILFIVLSFFRGRLAPVIPAFFLAGYLLVTLCVAVFTSSPVEDTLQAYKWVIYLIAFAFAVGRSWTSPRGVVGLTWALLGFALLKYVAARLVEGAGARPQLLVENNFELALLAGLVAVAFPHMPRRRWLAVAVLAVVVVLSGSRSGSVAFLILALYTIMQLRHRYKLAPLLAAYLAPLLAALPLYVFLERAANSTQIDRLNFLSVFFSEVQGWSWVNWLFGTMPLTPLSQGGCHRLSYYELLFSSEGDGTCYSVIFHAFVLRVIFDGGLLGLLLAFVGAWYFMRRGGVQVGLAFTLVAIALTNGLSVSGLNNPYVGLPILLAILIATPVNASVEAPRQAGASTSRLRPSQRRPDRKR